MNMKYAQYIPRERKDIPDPTREVKEVQKIHSAKWWLVALWLITFGKLGKTHEVSVETVVVFHESKFSWRNHVNCRCSQR